MESYLTIDAHQHFWQFDPVRDSWITEEMSVIRRNFFPAQLQTVLKDCGIDGSVAIQADQSEKETDFLLELAAENDFIRGVVGWVDLQSPNVEERLDHYSQYKKLKGFRHVLQGEPQRDLMLQPAFKKGISMLHKYGFTYDILIFPDQLVYVSELITAFPEQRFVIDHLAKPAIKNKDITEWKKDMTAVAACPNVYCKISGMVTEADWQNWKAGDFTPYLDTVVELFGPHRIMFGSDWPVCLVAASYKTMKQITDDYFASFSSSEREAFYGKNAIGFYNL